MTKPEALKSKEDRLKEGLVILNKLREIGIPPIEPGFQEIQNHISTWVNTGDAAAVKVPIPRFGRVAEIVLPRRRTAVASLLLKTAS